MWKCIGIATAVLIFSAVAFCADFVALKGKVTDVTGRPIEHATVMVYHAGVKNGYSVFCPSCYTDCGKRVFTDATGTYTFKNLDSELWFELVVVRDGYVPVFIKKIDPSIGPATTAVLSTRSGVDDTKRWARGRVVDSLGYPMRDAVVQPKGVLTIRGAAMYGEIPGLDPLAMTNDKGEFEASFVEPSSKMMLLVEARNMAPKFVVMATGKERQTIQLSEGAVIHGRLVADGMGVSGAEIGLIPRELGGYGPDLNLIGNPYEEVRIGTQKDGSFAITNVPSGAEWYVYGKMESLLGRGATEPIMCATTKDKEQLDVGDIEMTPGHSLRGKVTLGDVKPIPVGTRIIISSRRTRDAQVATLGSNGQFEFVSLPVGSYSIIPGVKGYALPSWASNVEISVDRDIDNWSIALTPEGNAATHR